MYRKLHADMYLWCEGTTWRSDCKVSQQRNCKHLLLSWNSSKGTVIIIICVGKLKLKLLCTVYNHTQKKYTCNISIWTKCSWIITQVLKNYGPQAETIDVTVTGRSSKALIVHHQSHKRHMSCASPELLEELSTKFPCKRRISIENNVFTACEK